MIIRGSLRACVVGTVAATALVLLAGCSSSGGSDASATSGAGGSTPSTAPVTVQLKPVLTERTAKGTDCTKPPSTGALSKVITSACSVDKTVYYTLGPAVISSSDVSAISKAQVDGSAASSDKTVVAVQLNTKGTAKLAALTKLASTQDAPRNEFAIVVDGQVVSSPQVADGAITGGQFQISFATEAAAKAFVAKWPSAKVHDQLPEPTASVG